MKILSPNLETWTLVPLSFKSFSFITFYDQPGGIQEDTGDTGGYRGYMGIQGERGYRGYRGIYGTQGIQGDTGATWDAGGRIQGAQGK